ncbi:MAG: hypothetical protein Q8S33_26040 [Myxococcales bacterium]|nr:hypothetical protein [Myxococcales bacterium]
MLSMLTVCLLHQAPEPRALLADWLAPEGCPSRADAASMLRPDVSPGIVTARVRIDAPRAPPAPWRAVIFTEVEGLTRTRVVEASSCEAVARAAVLVIELARTQASGAVVPVEPARESPREPPQVEPAAPSTPPADEAGDEVKGRAHRLRLRVSPMVALNVGVFPSVGVALGLGLSFGNETWRLDLGGLGWQGHRDPSGKAEFGLVSGLVRGCRFFALPKLALGPCGTVEAGALSVQGLELADARRSSVGWAAVLVGAKLHLDVFSVVQPWVSADVGVNLIRPRFVVNTPEGYEVLHGLGFPVGRLTIGVEFRWE